MEGHRTQVRHGCAGRKIAGEGIANNFVVDLFQKIRSNLTPMVKMTLRDFQSKGGKSKSPAKIRAVLANLKKAREAKKKKS